MKQLLLGFIFLLVPALIFAQNDDYKNEWKQVDSLLENGFPQTATQIAQSVYTKARQREQDVQMIKAQLYIMSSDFQRNEEAFQRAIQTAETNAVKEKFPNNAIWQSIAAQLYWSYYQQNRWKILGRTRTAAQVSIEDFEQWDAPRFFKKIASLYLASLMNAKALEKIPIEQYDPVLIKGVNTRNLRPSLFDLLAFRALEYFENDEKDIIQPAFAFVMNDPLAFAPASQFIAAHFQTQDTSSLQFQALGIYQQLLALHANDTSKDAFLDADLHRLKFAYNQSVLPNKEQRYREALARIESRYYNHPLSALAGLRIAELMMHHSGFARDEKANSQTSKPNYAAIKSKLDNIIARFPESEGGILARHLLREILSETISITTEKVVLPEEASKILITYKNVAQVYVRIYRLDLRKTDRKGVRPVDEEPDMQQLLSGPYLKQWSVSIPGSKDYATHSTEMKIDSLPTGTYTVVISAKKDFSLNENSLSYASFQASRLTAVLNSQQGFVLDRKTGLPIANANIDFFKEQYNSRLNKYELVESATVTSADDGTFKVPTGKNTSYTLLRLRYKKDAVQLRSYLNGVNYQPDNKPETKTFFFTDRSIYRPGQTIFFKGIMVSREDAGRKNTVLVNEQTAVTLYDVNGQKLQTKKFTSNEFGSFSGSFTAPQGLLTGNMQIRNQTGNVSFSVEEYKRPRFAVAFDTLKKTYALNETISLNGIATAYAGNAIDQATVRYRVVRRARFPYWWAAFRGGFPPSSEMEIANGTVRTDAQGKFKISFEALPDLSINPETMPVFLYIVSADVSDINGETHSNSQTVNVGYTALQLSLHLPEKTTPAELDTIMLTSGNLNNQFVKTTAELKISRLKAPEKPLRSRLWDTPDQYLMDSVTFKRFFPQDVYKDEDNKMNWAIARTVVERTITTNPKGIISLNYSGWETGWYLIEATAKDKNGKLITAKKWVQVYITDEGGKSGEALAVFPSDQTVEPRNKAAIYIKSGYDHLHLIVEATTPQQTTTAQWDISQGSGKEHIPVEESDRGGIGMSYITVKENRCYKEDAFITVPWSNKKLDIHWETHRDKLLPGSKETWTMVIRGENRDKVAAEMVATLYDASLDAFRPHSWNVYGLYPVTNYHRNLKALGFQSNSGRTVDNFPTKPLPSYEKSYDRLLLPDFYYRQYAYRTAMTMNAPAGHTNAEIKDAEAPGSVQKEKTPVAAKQEAEEKAPVSQAPPLRKNLQETAFFFPALKTDGEGNIRLEFTLPEALTEWKLLGFAHTKDMSSGTIIGTVKTQKDLMVMPNLPRFMRQGDEIEIRSKISNLSRHQLNGTASLELLNASTMQPVNLPFRLETNERKFSVAENQSTSVSWKLHVPESLYEPVLVRISASAGNFTDGEEMLVPIVTNRMLVTETLPLWMTGFGTKTFTFAKLLHSDTSKSLVQHALTVEYTANPAWYAVKSLPYLMEYPYECAEQVLNRYYATVLASHIVKLTPKIKAIFEQWKNSPDALSSQLQKNPELKSALLEETPWVLEANNEAEQRKRIGKLFDAVQLAKEQDATLRTLKEMQLPEGGFPWFKGMASNRYITQYIITSLGRLQALGVDDIKNSTQQIIAKALPYLDRQMKEDFDGLLKRKANMEQQQITYADVQYLYMRSFFNSTISPENKEAYDYFIRQSKKYWSKFNPYMKGMIALALWRSDDKATPQLILQSLKETAIYNEELGMYWMQPGNGYWWYEAPIEAQSLLIECFMETGSDPVSVNKMKAWLLKHKQTNHWATTKATADACFALLLGGSDWLTVEAKVSVHLGDTTIRSDRQAYEAGSGYFKTSLTGARVNPKMGNITLSVSEDQSASDRQNAEAVSWGAVYWQYFEDMDKISGAKTPLEIKKHLFFQKNTSRGPELVPLTSVNSVHIGDKLIIRIEIIVDRDMEFVHLKDMRASAFEPVNVISSYKWQGGLGYYESTRDASTNFFFDRLPKGKYVFEYPVFAAQAGNFANGIATIQCMYAPEFSSHSEGARIKVGDEEK